MSTDTKLSKVQVLKIIQSGGFPDKTFENFLKNVLQDLVAALSKYNLPKLATKAISAALNKLERKANAKCTVRVGKGFTSFLLNGDKDDIINIVESLE